MSHDFGTIGPDRLIRKAEPDNLEAQIKALKELQQQPGFNIRKRLSEKQEHRFISTLRRKWMDFKGIFIKAGKNKHST